MISFFCITAKGSTIFYIFLYILLYHSSKGVQFFIFYKCYNLARFEAIRPFVLFLERILHWLGGLEY
jgi:hypothetical protein